MSANSFSTDFRNGGAAVLVTQGIFSYSPGPYPRKALVATPPPLRHFYNGPVTFVRPVTVQYEISISPVANAASHIQNPDYEPGILMTWDGVIIQ